MNRENLVARVGRVEARHEPKDWRWASENRDAVAAHWAKRMAERPKMFNGRVLLVGACALESDVFRASYFETGFADFLAWRDLGYPDPSVANAFAMGALQGSDGAFICGVMGGHTSNAGRVYFPSGTPDPSDLRPDGTVDLAASVVRELEEETGLKPAGYRIADRWIVVQRWPAVALLRPVFLAEPAEAAAERIRGNIAGQDEPELADVRVIRGPADVDERSMPVFLQTFFRWSFAEAQR